MSLFNPIRSQYRRLEKVFEGDPALDLNYAASLMHIKPEKVAHSIQIMKNRQYFTPDEPVVDNRIKVLVRDKRYLPLAGLKRKTQKLQQSLQKAGSAAERVMGTPSNLNRGSILGSFVRDMVDTALSGTPPRYKMADRTGMFLRDMFGPDHRRTIAQFLNDDISGPLSMLISQTRQLADCLSSRPEQTWNEELAPFLDKLTGMVDAWCGCIPSGQLPTDTQLRTADKLSDRLEYEFIPQFQVLLEDIYHPQPKKAPEAPEVPKSDEQDPVLAELEARKRSFRKSLQQVKSSTLRASGAELDLLLRQIISLLAIKPEKSRRASIRSLQNTYLPMMEELAEKYLENEAAENPGPRVIAAMKTTEQLFEQDLPAALHNMLDDLQQDSAIDMVSQAAALRGKLKLDGLVK